MALKKKPATEGGEAARPPSLETLKKMRILIRAAQTHSSWVEKQCGITGGQLWLLQEVSEAGSLRVGEIAVRLAIHQSTASNLVDAMTRKNLVLKKRSESDQRVVQVTLSKKGETLLAKAPKPARGLLAEALSRIEPRELRSLDRGLNAVLQLIGVDADAAMELLPFML